MDDALSGLTDIEHADLACGSLGPQGGQEFPSNLDRPGASRAGRDGVIRSGKCQLRAVNHEAAAFEVQQAA